MKRGIRPTVPPFGIVPARVRLVRPAVQGSLIPNLQGERRIQASLNIPPDCREAYRGTMKVKLSGSH